MIIKVALVLVVLALLFWFLTNRNASRTRAGVKLALITFVLMAIIVIIFPEMANDIAHFLGVGRGADLILYSLVVAFIFLVLTLYIKSKDEQKRVVKLARQLALLEAKQSSHNQSVIQKL